MTVYGVGVKLLAKRNESTACCSSCSDIREVLPSNYCCCIHGKAYGVEFEEDGLREWFYPGAEEEYRLEKEKV